MRYWCAASLIAWGLLSLAGLYWRLLQASSATIIYLAMGAGCVANWFRNRTFHCGISAPVLLIAGVVSLLLEMHVIYVNSNLVPSVVLIGVGIAFLLEWRYAVRSG